MSLLQRVQDILLKPRDTWPVIAQEGGDTASVYSSYIVYLAAIPAVAAFIGLSLVGAGAFGISVRVPVMSGLVNMVVSYVLSLAALYSIYLIYTGIPVLIKCPPEKATNYTAVVVVCGIVATVGLTLASSLFTPSMTLSQ